jgi:hypothetical protein
LGGYKQSGDVTKADERRARRFSTAQMENHPQSTQ